MSAVVIVTAIPVPEHRSEVVAAFEEAIARVHQEPGVELYALHEAPGRLVMVEKNGSGQARSEHLRGAALAGLRSALKGKRAAASTRTSSCRTQPGTRRRARCDHGRKLPPLRA